MRVPRLVSYIEIAVDRSLNAPWGGAAHHGRARLEVI